MTFLEKHLEVKESTLPGAGKGLFTKIAIPKGTRIIEYKGKVTSWKDANKLDGNNGYIFYVSKSVVIDAYSYKKSLARYANDARGLSRVKGIRNNCAYVIEDKRVYIDALYDIAPGEEIFVSYGKEYWDVVRNNIRIEKLQAKKAAAQQQKKATKKKKPAKKAGEKVLNKIRN